MLKDHAAALLKEGTITAVNGGVLFSKLLQTSIGWVYGDDGKTYELDNHNRINALLDIIEGKIDSLQPPARSSCSRRSSAPSHGISAGTKTRQKIDFAEVSGDTTAGAARRYLPGVPAHEKYQVLNAHPECMSHGLTLTAADTIDLVRTDHQARDLRAGQRPHQARRPDPQAADHQAGCVASRAHHLRTADAAPGPAGLHPRHHR